MPCVLIVEDENGLRDLLSLLLRTSGYDTMTAANGIEALRRIDARHPSLVLLDLWMPVMDGWQFREAQLADPTIADIPVLCLTGMFNPLEVRRQLQVRCLPKPLSPEDLLYEVALACGAASA
jgi:CheY-like chemotaxis protein